MAKTEKQENYPIQLTWAKTWAVIVVAAGVVSGAFYKGKSYQTEMFAVEKAKYEKKVLEEYQAELGKKDSDIITLGIDRDFYKNQYRVTKSRLDTCIEKGTFLDNIISKDEK